jgi:hypothetical protein
MAYQINRYDNSILAVVQDGTIDSTSTDLKFIGRNYAGYGEFQNENFLYLLENFAGNNPPPRKVTGQVWFDKATKKLKFYDGTKWRTTGGSETSAQAPTGLSDGDFWWNTDTDQLYVYNGEEFILIGPEGTGQDVTKMVSDSVLDSTGNERNIVIATVNGVPVFVISSEEFLLDPAESLVGFDRIKKGLTLIDTTDATNGVTSSDFRFWGTSSNSDKLGGVPASDFVRQSNLTFNSVVNFSDSGIIIGNDLDLRIYVDGSEGIIENQTGNSNSISFKVRNSTGATVRPIYVTSDGVSPSLTNTFDLGTSDRIWDTVYASTFNGTATKADTLKVGSSYRSASIDSTNNTIAARDENGNLKANLFDGVATSTRYADLAEKYTTRTTIEVGTVVAICNHPDHECCECDVYDMVAGVISEKPALLMNSELDGQAVALKGRVPVKVSGPVHKGDAVYVSGIGVASVNGIGDLVGIALESNTSDEIKLVECFLKV